jgi:hypothetical protein
MINRIEISTQYMTDYTATVDLEEEGVTWEDIKQWYIKWDRFSFTTDGSTWREIRLDSWQGDADFKRPAQVYIYPTDEDESTDYGTLLGEA